MKSNTFGNIIGTIVVLFICGLTIALIYFVIHYGIGANYQYQPKMAETSDYNAQMAIIQGTSLIAISPLSPTGKLPVHSTKIDTPPEVGEWSLTYNTLIDCLIEKESNGNPEAYNPRDIDGYPKFGILQFHIPTFLEFCVEKYGLENNLWDEKIQKICADKMITDGYGWHWGTWSQCN